MNKKIIIIALLFTFGLLAPMANAAFTPGTTNVYVWADKTQCQPGDTITIYFTILNDRSTDIVINEVDIQMPAWYSYVRDHWEGNQTMLINKVIAAGTAYTNSTTFQIPADSRATASGTYIDISVIMKTTPSGSIPTQHLIINMANPPFTVHDMDTLVLLAAVLIILIVVCTALIAAAIFLSARKPQEAYPPPPQTPAPAPSQPTP